MPRLAAEVGSDTACIVSHYLLLQTAALGLRLAQAAHPRTHAQLTRAHSSSSPSSTRNPTMSVSAMGMGSGCCLLSRSRSSPELRMFQKALVLSVAWGP